uniref:Uncharacterized protein n=1 Tax=Arundo donax TaxID=35708 RepID=A0A0A9H1V6_ARUDO
MVTVDTKMCQAPEHLNMQRESAPHSKAKELPEFPVIYQNFREFSGFMGSPRKTR